MSAFEEDSMFDELRRFAAGAMSADERARFEARLRQEPELARRAGEFQAVWSATAAGVVPCVTSSTRFDDFVREFDVADVRRAWRRRAAAALVLLAVATSAWFAWRELRPTAEAVVELHAIPWSEASPASPQPATVPAVLANWSPVENGQIRWLDSIDEARAVSAAVSRPIFVFGYVEECPICQGFQRNEFQDPAVIALVDQAVPLRINLMELAPEDVQAIMARRYPLLEMQDERGTVLHTFAGMFAEVDMRAELARAVAGLARPDWKVVHELTAAFLQAIAAEATELPQFAKLGSAGLSRMGVVAANLLADARSAAPRGDRSALAAFGNSMERFAGTPYETDLRAVWSAWSESGRFPKLSLPK
jgi:hypothetical protein